MRRSWIVQRCGVRSAAMVGVRSCHFRPVLVAGKRRLSCAQQKVYTVPTRYMAAVKVDT